MGDQWVGVSIDVSARQRWDFIGKLLNPRSLPQGVDYKSRWSDGRIMYKLWRPINHELPGIQMMTRMYLLVLCISLSLSATANDKTPMPLFVVHFETGAHWNEALQPAEQTDFREHSLNLNRLRQDGIILFGARYGDYGMIVIKANSIALAKAMIDDDPGVKSGIFNFKIEPLNVFYPWRE